MRSNSFFYTLLTSNEYFKRRHFLTVGENDFTPLHATRTISSVSKGHSSVTFILYKTVRTSVCLCCKNLRIDSIKSSVGRTDKVVKNEDEPVQFHSRHTKRVEMISSLQRKVRMRERMSRFIRGYVYTYIFITTQTNGTEREASVERLSCIRMYGPYGYA